jgi:hypothetical protein
MLKRPPLILAYGLVVAFVLLRLTKSEDWTDLLIAVALALVECACIAGLKFCAEKRSHAVAKYRSSRVPIDALEAEIVGFEKEITDERRRYLELVAALKEREAMTFDPDVAADAAAAAVEAEYRGGVNWNQRALEGGAVVAIKPFKSGHYGMEV